MTEDERHRRAFEEAARQIADEIRELRGTLDLIDANGAVTIVGRHGLSRWLVAAEPQ
jgi:hypothetical protein